MAETGEDAQEQLFLIVCVQGLGQELEERTRTLADVEAARKSQQQEWEKRFTGLQEDSKAMEKSLKLKVIFSLLRKTLASRH